MDKETKKEFEKLGGIVKRGLKSQEKRFDQKLDNMSAVVKRGFDSVDKRFEQVDKRFEGLENEMRDGFRSVNARLSTIEHDVADIRKHFVYRDEFEDLVARVKYLEKKLDIVSGK